MVERFASNVTLLQNTCPGLVQQIEKGELDTRKTRLILETALQPMLERGIDTVVLGCTHYPFVIPLIQEIVGADVRVIDPAPAVARQVERMLGLIEAQSGSVRLHEEGPVEQAGRMYFFTSGDVAHFQFLLPKLLGENGEIRRLGWAGNEIHM